MKPERFALTLGDPGYPGLLAASPDPPRVLYGMGDPAVLAPSVAVVGARKATPYGLRCAALFGGWLAERGVSVVSGAALGCDSAAHTAALETGGRSVAVLGCGPDIDYPVRSRALLREMREHHAVLSECPFGQAPQRWAFVRRNRIIAGLSLAVVVVEAGLPSGTFSTADAALDAGREVFAVPGSILSPESRGSNRLIQQGAIPLCEVGDLAAALGLEAQAACAMRPDQDPIAAALRASPMRPDDIARELRRDIVDVARTLGSLEAAGAVRRYPDGRWGAV